MSKPAWDDWVPVGGTRFGPPSLDSYWGVGCIWSNADNLDHEQTRDMVIRSVNLIGPHLDDAERMAAFRAVAGMDDLDLSRLVDFMKDHGLMEME